MSRTASGRWATALVLAGCGLSANAASQCVVDVAYGAVRAVESSPAEVDGWVSASLQWTVKDAWSLGLGADHQFEAASPSPSQHQSSAVYLFSAWTLPRRRASPFVKLGLGWGPAPCRGDTCDEGLYLRVSGGVRAHLQGRLGTIGEAGWSRVGRPFAGVGLSVGM